ncbi:hypothetical protein AX15_007706 [Amanita polypyramis BW_CC]|nr:hypothetical protein AX15_007706 [Amanita polypyramis BW_CC]
MATILAPSGPIEVLDLDSPPPGARSLPSDPTSSNAAPIIDLTVLVDDTRDIVDLTALSDDTPHLTGHESQIAAQQVELVVNPHQKTERQIPLIRRSIPEVADLSWRRPALHRRSERTSTPVQRKGLAARQTNLGEVGVYFSVCDLVRSVQSIRL